jgi:hypothetical protein
MNTHGGKCERKEGKILLTNAFVNVPKICFSSEEKEIMLLLKGPRIS